MADSGTPILGLTTTAALLDTDVLPLARPSGTTAPGTDLGITGRDLKAMFNTALPVPPTGAGPYQLTAIYGVLSWQLGGTTPPPAPANPTVTNATFTAA